MDMLKMMLSRRSIRRYTEEAVTDEELRALLTAGLSSATGHAYYPCRYIVVKNKEMLQKLSHCRKGSAMMLQGASAAIVMLGDENISETWIEDCSIVMTNMQQLANDMGLGSCWIQGRLREAENGGSTEDYVRSLLRFPENLRLEAILSVGHPAVTLPARKAEELRWDEVHYEVY